MLLSLLRVFTRLKTISQLLQHPRVPISQGFCSMKPSMFSVLIQEPKAQLGLFAILHLMVERLGKGKWLAGQMVFYSAPVFTVIWSGLVMVQYIVEIHRVMALPHTALQMGVALGASTRLTPNISHEGMRLHWGPMMQVMSMLFGLQQMICHTTHSLQTKVSLGLNR